MDQKIKPLTTKQQKKMLEETIVLQLQVANRTKDKSDRAKLIREVNKTIEVLNTI